MIEVRPLREEDRGWVRSTIRERWGSEIVVAHGVAYEPTLLPGFVAEDESGPIGLLTYVLEGDGCEIVERRGFTLVAVHEGAVDRSRVAKPEIPLLGDGGIEIHDELRYGFRPE